jgi:hypothetical protein
MTQRKKSKFFSFFFFLAILFFFAKSSVLASDVSIKATMPDILPPSVPILIEPSDGSLLAENKPSFKWYESSDNVGLFYYSFYLDGNILYNNIPLVSTANEHYSLNYDVINGVYTLTPKDTILDGNHTWKIAVADYANLTAASDTWSFTIDTLAPTFILKKIGDTAVDISSANPGSVPSDPIIIFANDATANEPLLIAAGEANSEVRLTVLFPDDPTQNFTKNVDGNGYYELKLGILPRDTDIRLDFIILDSAGHISILEKVYFRISLQYWPTASPTPTATSTTSPSPSPSPTLTKTLSPKPSTTKTLTPTINPTITISPSPSATPSGIIPIIPPREIIHNVSNDIVEALPESTASYIREFFNSDLWKSLSLFFAFLLLLLFYLFSFLLLLSKFIQNFSWPLLKKVFILLFPPLFKAKKNLVFEYRETLASPLAKVELLDQNEKVLDFAITNIDGNFNDLDYPKKDQWRLRVKDDNFYYPIGDKKPDQLEFWHFYQNQLFNESYGGQAILIPTLRAAGQTKLPLFERLRIFVLYLLDYPTWFLIVSLLFSLIFTLRYPALYNYISLGFYSFILLYKIFVSIKNKLKVTLLVQLIGGQQFSDNLIISFFDQKNKSAISMVMPFDFSKSKLINHSFESAFLTAFAKNLVLEKNDLSVDSQVINFSGKQEEISLQIKKI